MKVVNFNNDNEIYVWECLKIIIKFTYRRSRERKSWTQFLYELQI